MIGFDAIQITIAVNLLYAAFLGALIGAERGRKGRAAGMRTYALVALGAAFFASMSVYGFEEFRNQAGVQFDPSRIISNIVVGIGFLGAGIIIFRQEKGLQGLTTAAGLWVTAAIGMAVGVGMYAAAAFATALVVAILYFLLRIEYLLGYKGEHDED